MPAATGICDALAAYSAAEEQRRVLKLPPDPRLADKRCVALSYLGRYEEALAQVRG